MADRFDLINFGKSVVTTTGGTTANVNIDANTLFIDGTNNRVGVGTSTPTAALQVAGDIVSSGTVVPGSSYLRNRIINGDMRIDQRNGGQSVTPTAAGYGLDRWNFHSTASSKYSVQQNGGSVTPPAGFTNYIGFTSISSYAVTSSDVFAVSQQIEGSNVSDLNWGSASAQTVTLSFWVRSSLTGTFGGALSNSGQNRGYAFTYTINAPNVWEYKTITVPGDTTGTWLTNTNTGVGVRFAFGVGSTFSGSAGSWAASNLWSATGATSVVGTNGATFYLTGVQFEVGSVATPFERRQFGDEFALCQRYFQRNDRASGIWYSGNQFRIIFPLPVRMRSTVGQLVLFDSNGYHEWWNAAGYNGISAINLASGGVSSVDVQITSSSNRGRSFNDPAILERDVLGFGAEL